MYTLPIELIEQIISNLHISAFSSICHVNKTLYILSRIELYKRWKNYAIEFGKMYYEELDLNKKFKEGKLNWAKYDELSCYIAFNQRLISDKQLAVMRTMLINKMIIDPQEIEIVRYCLSEWSWIEASLIWDLDWEWKTDEYEEEIRY